MDTAGELTDRTYRRSHMGVLPPQNRSSPAVSNFTGTAYYQPIAVNETAQLRAMRVTFEKGARTFWHVHAGEQVLYFLQGRGRVQVRGERLVDAAGGDVARIPPETEHWHGAHPAEEQAMVHLAITFGAPTWGDPVSEAEYHASAQMEPET